MFKVFSTVTTGIDNTHKIKQLIDEIAKKQVYVGIPEEDNAVHRGDMAHNANHSNKVQEGKNARGEGEIKNAELLYILSHGVRSKGMIDEMNMTMGIDSSGMPYTAEYNKFVSDLDSGKSYSAAYQMYMQAHGSALWRVPPRPVLEPSIEHNKAPIAEQLKLAAKATLDGKDAITEMGRAGMMAQNFARDWFTNPANMWPANSPATIKQKGSDRPLIDTAQLRRSITYTISE